MGAEFVIYLFIYYFYKFALKIDFIFSGGKLTPSEEERVVRSSLAIGGVVLSDGSTIWII